MNRQIKMDKILELKNISKIYENENEVIEALKDVNLEINESTFNVIIGPSGCGKATILRIIANLIKPSSGEIVWHAPGVLAFIFQNFALFPFMNVKENIEFGLKMKNVDQQERDKIAKNLIRELGLEGFEEKHPKELSGGMKQRVGIARALAIEPNLFLMDEPFSSLDEMTAENLRELILKICSDRKITVLMVTHLVSEAVKLSDNIFVMSPRPGRIIEFFENPLPKPREERSEDFYKLEDRLKAKIKQG